jgi:hypothetical protein
MMQQYMFHVELSQRQDSENRVTLSNMEARATRWNLSVIEVARREY